MYKKAVKDVEELGNKSDWYVDLFPVTETGIFTAEKIEKLKKEMSEVEFAQEFMCDFAQAAENDLFSLELLDRAFERTLKEEEVPEDEPLIGGGDIARYGDDSTVLCRRKG